MKKITKASQLRDLPYDEWPAENYPEKYEDLGVGNISECILDWYDVWIATGENDELADEFLEALAENFKDPRYQIVGKLIYRVYDGKQKRRYLYGAQKQYAKGKRELWDYLHNYSPEKNLCTALAYMHRENIKWDLEDNNGKDH